ncbi:hypothetical protein [Motilibacter deserti]|uniref:Secreted protein n=1 Tax=Motilibacter deserti TaxID=2714956 RepID=A0ABX0GW79_9ACTN|nr:hypothetical protein [Motilibacter deserti]NHC15052.1 hypothetical protein [Motilibacter deserti]
MKARTLARAGAAVAAVAVTAMLPEAAYAQSGRVVVNTAGVKIGGINEAISDDGFLNVWVRYRCAPGQTPKPGGRASMPATGGPDVGLHFRSVSRGITCDGKNHEAVWNFQQDGWCGNDWCTEEPPPVTGLPNAKRAYIKITLGGASLEQLQHRGAR